MAFLPTNRKEMLERGWEQLDIIIVSGDAYVDHPAWASAILGRFLEKQGYRVGIIAQPAWNDNEDIELLGCPRLFFAVSGGNMDSMVNHYTADRKKRRQDLFSPGGRAGLRPDRATIVYCNLIRQHFPGIPVVIGGIEASLRRFAHYDYWSDSIRRSILLDSKADLLVYGMGEYTLAEIARRVDAGEALSEIRDLEGTCFWSRDLPQDAVQIPAYEECRENPRRLVDAILIMNKENNPYRPRVLAERNEGRWVVQNPPPIPLNTRQLDLIYDMDFSRTAHPGYGSLGGVPALEPVQFSITSHRGCFGGCSFCSLALHQGKFIQSRSIESIINEGKKLVNHKDFKGTISDVGGPSANMYGLGGRDVKKCQNCQKYSCLYPRPCANLNTDHNPGVRLLKQMRSLNGARHVFISSGVRYDLIMQDESGAYLSDLCNYHVGGQLKIAPEHISLKITQLMQKPSALQYRKFNRLFKSIAAGLKKNIYLVPYFISGHPGNSLKESIELAQFLKNVLDFQPEQIQNFTPTPMTFSTCMYASGINPFTGKEIYVPRSSKERKLQRALLQCRNSRNRELALEALRKAGRQDLIGSGPGCLLSEHIAGRGERSKAYKGNNKKNISRNRKSRIGRKAND